MPKQKRIRTEYPGVYYIRGRSQINGKPERIYYVYYYKKGKRVEEKAGRQFQNAMTPAKANRLRAAKIEGKVLTNKEYREEQRKQKMRKKERWTLSRLWEEYARVNPGLKGFHTDNNRFKKDIEPVLGNKEPSQLTPLDIDDLKLNLMKRLKPQTVKNTLELIRRITNFGFKKQLTHRLTLTIDMPKNINNETTGELSGTQVARLPEVLDNEPDPQGAHLMKLALFSGMRRGELFRLQWKDIKCDDGFIVLLNTKSGKMKTIPLNDTMREIVKNHPRTDSPFVFPGRGGKMRKDIAKPLNLIKEKAGLPQDFRPLHGLRHVYATMLANSGEVDPYSLQNLLTHSSHKMTERYISPRNERLVEASNVMVNEVKKIQHHERIDK